MEQAPGLDYTTLHLIDLDTLFLNIILLCTGFYSSKDTLPATVDTLVHPSSLTMLMTVYGSGHQPF